MMTIAALLLAVATPLSPVPVEHRLSDAEIEKVLAEAAIKREAVERAAGQAGLQVHGEIGVSIGTGGYRSVQGRAAIELAEDGLASVSFESSDSGRSDRRARDHD